MGGGSDGISFSLPCSAAVLLLPWEDKLVHAAAPAEASLRVVIHYDVLCNSFTL